MYPTSMTYKLLYYFKDYFDITLILLQAKEKNNLLLENYEKLGIKLYFFDPYKNTKEKVSLLMRLLIERLKGYKFVVGKTGPNWHPFLLFKIFNSSKKIYFSYDLFLFLWKNQNTRPWMGRMFEKNSLKNADFIIHKGPKDQFDLVTKDEVKKIKGRPIQFISCFDDWIVPINKKKTKELSIVYIGICPDKETIFRIPFPEYFKIISNQGINLDIYSIKTAKQHEFTEIKKKNITYHNSMSNKLLNKEISKYHYGSAVAFFDKNIVDDRFLKTTLGNKFMSYLEAGIPIIINDEMEFFSDLIRKYNCGVVISEKDLPNLKKILKKQNYSKLVKGVKRAREDLLMSKDIKKMVQILNIK